MSTDLSPRDTLIAPGDAAPNFTLKDQKIEDWTLADHLGTGGDVVLCFYPMDFSPVCSAEMTCVTDELAGFAGKNATVVGVSCDSFFAHKAWAESLGIKQTLLADMHREVCKAYGLYFADLNVAARGTVVIGSDGVVKWSEQRELGDAMNNADVLVHLA